MGWDGIAEAYDSCRAVCVGTIISVWTKVFVTKVCWADSVDLWSQHFHFGELHKDVLHSLGGTEECHNDNLLFLCPVLFEHLKGCDHCSTRFLSVVGREEEFKTARWCRLIADLTKGWIQEEYLPVLYLGRELGVVHLVVGLESRFDTPEINYYHPPWVIPLRFPS